MFLRALHMYKTGDMGPQVIEVRCRRSGRMGGQGLRRLAGYLGGNWDPGRLGGPGVRGAVAV
jgi:hypothetical protein